ncbi:hypothetical protein RIF29_21491 [Crotalaria pallida]|uniref:Uncharacterized protein n=1 Tax=Crotalaria pallida TaxID=3830 RepID=A0AAN9F328_CROPI
MASITCLYVTEFHDRIKLLVMRSEFINFILCYFLIFLNMLKSIYLTLEMDLHPCCGKIKRVKNFEIKDRS